MGTGRKSIPIRKIDNLSYRRVAFCKRSNGLFKKSHTLSTLTPGSRIAVLAFSTSTAPHLFDTHDDDDDNDYDFASFLEQAADAFFGNSNSLIRSRVTNSNPSFEIESIGDDCLNVQEDIATAVHGHNLISNPNFGIENTTNSLLVQEASAVNGQSQFLNPNLVNGNSLQSPIFETVERNQDLNIGDADENLCLTEKELLELMRSDDNDDNKETPVSVSSASGNGGSFSTMIDDTSHNVCNRYQQQIISNSPSCPPPVDQYQQHYNQTNAYTYTNADCNYMLNSVRGNQLMMQFGSSGGNAYSLCNTGVWNDGVSGLSQFGCGGDIGYGYYI